jgi:hypothetical protein
MTLFKYLPDCDCGAAYDVVVQINSIGVRQFKHRCQGCGKVAGRAMPYDRVSSSDMAAAEVVHRSPAKQYEPWGAAPGMSLAEKNREGVNIVTPKKGVRSIWDRTPEARFFARVPGGKHRHLSRPHLSARRGGASDVARRARRMR